MDYEYSLSPEETMLRYEHEQGCRFLPEKEPRKIRVSDSKRDMPQRFFLAGLACLMVFSLRFLNLEWGRVVDRLCQKSRR